MATLAAFRAALIWGSFSPLFIIWAVRGLPLPDAWTWGNMTESHFVYWLAGVLLIVLVPHFLIWVRWFNAERNRHHFTQTFSRVDDAQSRLLEYLLAVLLAVFFVDISEARELLAAGITVLFLIWLFSKLDLHHVNPWLIWRGYHIYIAEVPTENRHRQTVYILSRSGPPPVGVETKVLRLDNRLFVIP